MSVYTHLKNNLIIQIKHQLFFQDVGGADCIANQHSDIDPQLVLDLGWVPLLALMIYIFFFSIGKKTSF